MRFSTRTFCAFFVILVGRAAGDDIIQRFMDNVKEIVNNNLNIMKSMIKESTKSLREECMGETQQNIELFLSQTIVVFEDITAQLEKIAHGKIREVSKEIGVDVEPERKCLKMLYDGIIRTTLNNLLLNKDDSETVKAEREKLRKKQINEAYDKAVPLKKLLGRPQVARPYRSNVSKDFHGYALDNNNRRVIVVDKRAEKDKSFCYPDYVEHYSDAMVDQIANFIIYYLDHYGYRAKLDNIINENTQILSADIKQLTDRAVEALKMCPEIVETINRIYVLYHGQIKNLMVQAAQEY